MVTGLGLGSPGHWSGLWVIGLVTWVTGVTGLGSQTHHHPDHGLGSRVNRVTGLGLGLTRVTGLGLGLRPGLWSLITQVTGLGLGSLVSWVTGLGSPWSWSWSGHWSQTQNHHLWTLTLDPTKIPFSK